MTQNENQAGWSREPWMFGSLMTLGANCSGYHVRDSEGKSRAFVFQLADAERIPACVNFLAGMSASELDLNTRALGHVTNLAPFKTLEKLNADLCTENTDLRTELSTLKTQHENLLQWLREKEVLADKEAKEWLKENPKSLVGHFHEGKWNAFHMTEKKLLGDDKV